MRVKVNENCLYEEVVGKEGTVVEALDDSFGVAYWVKIDGVDRDDYIIDGYENLFPLTDEEVTLLD